MYGNFKTILALEKYTVEDPEVLLSLNFSLYITVNNISDSTKGVNLNTQNSEKCTYLLKIKQIFLF